MDDRNIDLASENIDVALRLGAPADSPLSPRKLATCKRLVVASTGYVAARGVPKRPGDLLNREVIVHAQQVGGDDWRFRKGTSETSERIQSRLAFAAAEGVRDAVVAGHGLAIVSEWMMAPELASGEVAPVLAPWHLPDLDLWAKFPAGRMPSARTPAFVDWLRPRLERAPACRLV